jgi:hypothetical protein
VSLYNRFIETALEHFKFDPNYLDDEAMDSDEELSDEEEEETFSDVDDVSWKVRRAINFFYCKII